MFETAIFHNYRIVVVTSTTSAQVLKALIDAVVAGKSAPANVLPSNEILQMALTCSANMEFRDVFTGDLMTLTSGVRYVFPVINMADKVTVKNAGTIVCELFFGH